MVTSFVNIFSCSVSCRFILFMVSFAVKKKILSLIRLNLGYSVFIFITLEGGSKKYCCDSWEKCSESVLPILSYRSFIVFGLIFRSLVHFEFIFVYGVRKGSSFILLQAVDQISQHHLLRRLSLIHCIFLPPLSKIRCSPLQRKE